MGFTFDGVATNPIRRLSLGGELLDLGGEASGSLGTGQHGAQPGGALHAAATPATAGFMPPADKEKLDRPFFTARVRNETGAAIPAQRTVALSGEAPGLPAGRRLVAVADKDIAVLRPCRGMTLAEIPDQSDGEVAVYGFLPYDTTTIAIDLADGPLEPNDQLVLGDAGGLSRPPPDRAGFFGEVQSIGAVSIPGVVGEIFFNPGGLDPTTASQVFALDIGIPVGITAGGGVNRAGGLNVDVAAGEGFVIAGGSFRRVLWGATTLALPANETRTIVVDLGGVVQSISGIQPNLTETLVIATARTDASVVTFLSSHFLEMDRVNERAYQYAQEILGPLTSSGGTVPINAGNGLRFDVDAALFYVLNSRKQTTSRLAPTFNVWFQDGLGGHSVQVGETEIDPDSWDDGTGPTAVPAGEWTKPLVMITLVDGVEEFHVIMGQQTFATQLAAEEGPLPLPPQELRVFALALAGLVVQQGSIAITSVTDERPFLGQVASQATGPAATSPSPHGMGGVHHASDTLENVATKVTNLDLLALRGTSGTPSDANRYVTNADPRNADARTPVSHAATHQHSGGDEIATVTAGANAIPKAGAGGRLAGTWVTYGSGGDTAAEGNDARIPTQDENNALQGTSGSPTDANRYVTNNDARNTNARVPTGAAGGGLAGTYPNPTVNGMIAGVLANDAAHGARGGGTQHAAATGSVAGFMSAADKGKLDGLEPGGAAEHVSLFSGTLVSDSVVDANFSDAFAGLFLAPPSDGDYFAMFSGEFTGTVGNITLEVAIGQNSTTVAVTNSGRNLTPTGANNLNTFLTTIVLPGLTTLDQITGIFRKASGSGDAQLIRRRITIFKVTA